MESENKEKTRPLVSLIRLLALPFRYKAASGVLAFFSTLACIYALQAAGVQFGISIILAIFLLVAMIVFYLVYLSILKKLWKMPVRN